MTDSWKQELFEACLISKTLAIAIFNISGELKYCNQAMSQMCKGKPNGNFLNPTLEKMLEITREHPFSGIITFADETEYNYSIEATAIQKNSELLVYGEVNVGQLVMQNAKMTLLNQQINNLQRQLIKEKKMLDKANQDLSELNNQKNKILGIVAHDLRNPVGLTYSFADMMLDDFDGISRQDVEKYLENIRMNSNYALALLNDLLDISAIEAGRLELKKENVEYIDLIEKIIEEQNIFAQKKQIIIVFQADVVSINFSIDPIRIRQVLSNLISNALKYSEKGTTVKVKCSFDGDLVKTEVADQGEGIAADELASLFQPFHTTKNKTTAGEKSTGLGLSIAKKIVSLHGGRIEVESTVGIGSVFSFWLPINELQTN